MTTEEPIVTFQRVYLGAPWPIRSDNTALGTAPALAIQFCESFRTACSFGWYVFPPADVNLWWDGGEVRMMNQADGMFYPFADVIPDESFLSYWRTHAPPDLADQPPTFVSNTAVPGIVQVWSGLLVSTLPGYGVLVRPLVNFPRPGSYQCLEGLVETNGAFQPCPLFTNVRLIEPYRLITLRRTAPLFQVQPVALSCITRKAMDIRCRDGIQPSAHAAGGMSAADWDGFRRTTRPSDPTLRDRVAGSYGAQVRRRRKRDDPGTG